MTQNFLTIEAQSNERVVEVLEGIKYLPSPAEAGGAKYEISEYSSDLSLERILPTPSGREKGEDLLAWRQFHWGTHWDVHAKVTARAEGLALIEFHSEGGPPTEAFLRLGTLYPDVSFVLEYRTESGMTGRITMAGDQ